MVDVCEREVNASAWGGGRWERLEAAIKEPNKAGAGCDAVADARLVVARRVRAVWSGYGRDQRAAREE